MDWRIFPGKAVIAALAAAALAGLASAADDPKHPAVSEVAASRPFLRYERPLYRNFVYDPFIQ